MDPNANLKRQRELSAFLLSDKADDLLDQEPALNLMAAATELAELVEALDGWLSNKGFLPGRWSR
jgi:hypothetical protein